MAGPLLATKLHVPRRRGGLVARPRLSERLGPSRDAGLTLLSAPAGFGKTTLPADWLSTDPGGRPVAWLSLDEDDLGYVREFEHLTLARVLLARPAAERDLAAVARLLARLLRAAEEGQRAGSVIEALVLRAVADPGAIRAHVRRVLHALDGPGVVRPGQPGLVEPLSTRELDVLRLLASDLDGPGIARELFVSLNTVRTHTKAIYAKLGVNNRRAAVRRAGELGLTSRDRGRRPVPGVVRDR